MTRLDALSLAGIARVRFSSRFPASILTQVEGAPVVVKKGLKKEEAEELQKKLEAVGAKIVLE